MTGFICSPPIYKYGKWTFEYKPHTGPWPITKDGNPYKRVGNAFYDAFERWNSLPNKEDYRIGGGCERF